MKRPNAPRSHGSTLAIHTLTAALAVGALAASALAVQGVRVAGGGPRGRAVPAPVPGPPVILATLAEEATVHAGEDVRFRVSATDPAGQAVSLRLLNPPAELVFHPFAAAPSGSETEVHWPVPHAMGRQVLLFEAHVSAEPRRRSRLALPVSVQGGGSGPGILTGDVTGDGLVDVVGGSHLADQSVADQGIVMVWSGVLEGGGPQVARLEVPDATAGDGMEAVGLADVTGDGVLDVVARAAAADVGGVVDAGEVYVFAGSLALVGTVSPTARLSVPGAGAGDGLGTEGVRIVDVTGDGILDLIAAASHADVGGVSEAGAIHVFAGGPGLSGATAPDATLVVPGASSFDRLGTVVRTADVTGDGCLDVVAAAELADVGGVANAGAAYVFAGGSGLAGTVGPTASLTAPALVNDRLGSAEDHPLHFADVTGDAVLDVVALAPGADVGGVADAGAAYVFAGGPPLTGAVSPLATLRSPTPETADGFAERDVRAAELTGDGHLDLVVVARAADVGGVADAGAAHVFAGGPTLSGTPTPHATLAVPGAAPGDGLGVFGVQVGDVTRDGVLDVAVTAPAADVGGVLDAGAAYVFAGGSALSGTPGPHATLTVPGAADGDAIGNAMGEAVQLADVTGDGYPDVVVGASLAGLDVFSCTGPGAVYVFAGGPGLTGASTPTANLTPDPACELTLGWTSGQGVLLVDVTADGILDVVAGAPDANLEFTSFAGAVYVYPGGPGMVGTTPPRATFWSQETEDDHRLGDVPGQAIQVVDVTQDGIPDVVTATHRLDANGVFDAGAVYVFAGGSDLSGVVAPHARLSDPAASSADRLGIAGGRPVHAVDLDGDGDLEVLAAATSYDALLASDAGGIHVFTELGVTGEHAPAVTLERPLPQNGDALPQ